MARSKRDIGIEILEGLREIKRREYGRVINIPDVATIREKTGLSQARFAQLLGVSVRTLQDWEQGRRVPAGAARTLLIVARKNPRVLLRVAYAEFDALLARMQTLKARKGMKAAFNASPSKLGRAAVKAARTR
jgi:putative transcriptional regulator